MSERKEVLQLNGLTILVVITLIANFLIVGFFYRFHSYKLFMQEKRHGVEYTHLLKTQHDLHLEIAEMEGVKTWNETGYMKNLNIGEFGK